MHLPAPQTSPYVFSSPHSGREYLPTFLSQTRLDAHMIRSSEDAFIDQLFDCAPKMGAPLLLARAPRAYIDLNRGPDELDPAVIEGAERPAHNPRISSGLGVIPRVVSGGRAIYTGKISRAEAEGRLRDCWHPWHDRLRGLINDTHSQFGEAILIDCHSMPHEAIELQANKGMPAPQIVLGDRFGAAASRAVVDRVAAAFETAGLRVSRNMPFAGAYITQAYGRPSRQVHAVQIEIDRRLYMDEARIEPHADFPGFRNLINGVIAEIIGTNSASGMPLDTDSPLAAE
nr:N-formylglutamate amidohydrolase [Pseudogemmobacter hezensis]